MDEQLATDYAKNLSQGGALVTVTNTSPDVDELTIREVLAKYGATESNVYSAYVA